MEPPSIPQLETELSRLKAQQARAPNMADLAEAGQRVVENPEDPEIVKAYIVARAECDAAAVLPAKIADAESRLAAAKLDAADRALQAEYVRLVAKRDELAARYAQLERQMAPLQAQFNTARGSDIAQARDRIVAASPELFAARNALAEAKRSVSACLAKVNNLIGNPWKNKAWAELLLKGQHSDQPKVTVATQLDPTTPDLGELTLAEQIARMPPTWESEN